MEYIPLGLNDNWRLASKSLEEQSSFEAFGRMGVSSTLWRVEFVFCSRRDRLVGTNFTRFFYDKSNTKDSITLLVEPFILRLCIWFLSCFTLDDVMLFSIICDTVHCLCCLVTSMSSSSSMLQMEPPLYNQDNKIISIPITVRHLVIHSNFQQAQKSHCANWMLAQIKNWDCFKIGLVQSISHGYWYVLI